MPKFMFTSSDPTETGSCEFEGWDFPLNVPVEVEDDEMDTGIPGDPERPQRPMVERLRSMTTVFKEVVEGEDAKPVAVGGKLTSAEKKARAEAAKAAKEEADAKFAAELSASKG